MNHNNHLSATLLMLGLMAPACGPSCDTKPSPTPAPSFQVGVELTPEAEAQIARERYAIGVTAFFYGFPTRAARRCANEMGEISLGTDKQILPGAGVAVFSRSQYDGAKLRLLKNGDVRLLINVYSTGPNDPDNLLNCDIFEDRLSRAVNEGVRICCRPIRDTKATAP